MSATTTTTTVMDRRTYWCHECDMSITLIPTTSLCPHCNSDFIEELDSPITFNNTNPNNNINNNNQLLFPSFLDDPSIPEAGNPFFHRVITHLFNSDHHNPTTSRHHSPASKSAIESIPSVKITPGFLQIDPIVICAVCKDQFVIDDLTKELPCKHLYHSDCILPWLSQRNSCPVCRFQLPIDPVDGDSKIRRRSRSRVLRLGDLVDEEDDGELLGFGLRHLARRHRLVFPGRDQRGGAEGLFSPTQIGEEVQVDMDVVTGSGRTNSVETVSSWPSWPVDGGAIDTRVNDDDDVVMS
ncbi:E3 ubiquitin-protein ligase RDUF2-like [Bidens hawaiensis]|uniref:E3 ubiquitin-protein ligase RDUF2-like n=1 Tax=Bidens hawaiensis TaxID=980011 RepID=UPI00404A6661